MKWTSVLIVIIFYMAGCDNLPGDNHTHSTLIGGDSQSANPLGAAGAYIVGVAAAKDDPSHREELLRASHNAETVPAKIDAVARATTADLNNDGYVTLDEVIAMRNAGLSDAEMITRLNATGYSLRVTRQQEQFLRDRGVDLSVVNAMKNGS